MKKQNEVFLEAQIKNLPRSLEAALTRRLFREGCWGTQEILGFSQTSLKYPPKIEKKKFIDISAFFKASEKERLEIILTKWLSDHSPDSSQHWMIQKNQDWLKEWKKHFSPFELCGLHFVPAWLFTKKYKRSESVLINPGMAFGTGSHATTQFAIQMLNILKENGQLKKAKVVDIGAGSGILSVVAERFGAAQILSNDNDPESWRECSKMFKLNKTKNCEVTQKQSSELNKKFDVVVANIIDGVLIDIKEDLWRICKKNGFIVLSGILTAGSSAFSRSFLNGRDAQVICQVCDEEWTGLLIENKS